MTHARTHDSCHKKFPTCHLRSLIYNFKKIIKKIKPKNIFCKILFFFSQESQPHAHQKSHPRHISIQFSSLLSEFIAEAISKSLKSHYLKIVTIFMHIKSRSLKMRQKIAIIKFYSNRDTQKISSIIGRIFLKR